MSLLEALAAVLAGLWRTLKKALLTVGILAAIGLLALVLALPLWAFASLEPRIYTWFALAALAAGVVFLLLRRIVRRSRQDGGLGAWVRLRVLPAVRRAGIALALAAAAYSAVVLFARGMIALGAAIGVAVVVLGGYLRFVRRGRSERS